ncbi:uncharacterized protein LOC135848469 [Planococcus citri]|uniref:uncharacterized protein LOC135848469 n=1 Tax=Planococcus citri TaxID=170843 RepID=UPI0031F9E448
MYTSYSQCAHGQKYYKLKNQKHRDHPIGKQKRFRIQNTKKMDCLAAMKVCRVIYFPEFRLNKDVTCFKRKKTEMMNNLRKKLISGEVEGREKYYIFISPPSAHNHPVMTTYLNQKLDDGVKNEIKKLVDSGITSTFFIKASLKKFILELPNGQSISKMSKAFYPSKKIIANYIAKFTLQNRTSNIDQVALQSKVDNWAADESANIFYRPHDTEHDFLLCYQTAWQQKLLQKFGNIALLDATYKTVKYALPMFCLAVKTNVNYCIVGMFITLSETADKIEEALRIFKSWNSSWNPQYFVVDFSEAEINALKAVFGCYVYLCDFHWEQAWGRWVKKRENLDFVADEKKILEIFRWIANSRSEVQFEDNIESLTSNEVYLRNPKASRYFENTWLTVKDMWIRCFFPEDFIFKIVTNNGIESQFKMLKYGYLKVRNVKTLSELMTLMVDDVFPDLLNKYVQMNSVLDSNYKVYNEEIPAFLRNRPGPFIEHVYERYTAAHQFSLNSIFFEGDKIKVRSETNPLQSYDVNFNKPFCSCEDFWRFRMPCKHFCAIFLHLLQVLSFEDLPIEYRNHPYITINEDFNAFGHNQFIDSIGADDILVPETQKENVNQDCNPDQLHHNVVNTRPDLGKKELFKIRETCKILIDKTYNIQINEPEDASVLSAVENMLQEASKKMNELQRVDFLPLRSSTNDKKHLLELPTRSRKSKKLKKSKENECTLNILDENENTIFNSIENTLIDNTIF